MLLYTDNHNKQKRGNKEPLCHLYLPVQNKESIAVPILASWGRDSNRESLNNLKYNTIILYLEH